MLSPRETLHDLVKEAAPALPVTKRVAVYRMLAEYCGDEKEAKELTQMAADLEAAERRFAEFAFKQSQKGCRS